MSTLAATIPSQRSQRLPLLPAWTMVAGVTLLVGLVFLTGEHRWDRSGLKDYVETAEERAIAAVGGNRMRRMAFFAIGVAGIGLLLIGRRLPALREPMGLCILLAAGWTFGSITWAEAAGFTLKRLLLLTLCISGVIGLASALSLRQLAIVLLCVTSSYLAFGILAEVLQGNFRPWTSGYRFAGTLHPNTQSTNCGAMALAALALWRRGESNVGRGQRRRSIFGMQHVVVCLFLCALFFLVLTKSRTALAAVLLVIGLIWATKKRQLGFNLVLGGVGLLLILMTSYAMTITGSGDSVGDAANMGRADSEGAFNGRLPIWEICLGGIGARFPIGVGYDGFWTADRIEDVSWRLGWSVSSVHSEYIELVLGLGVAGLALYLLTQAAGIFWFWLRYYRLGFGGDAMMLGLLLIGAIQGFMETGYLHPTALVPFITLTGMARLAFFTDHKAARQGAI